MTSNNTMKDIKLAFKRGREFGRKEAEKMHLEFVEKLKKAVNKGIRRDVQRYGICEYCADRFDEEINRFSKGEEKK